MTVDAHPIADLPNPADYGFTVVDRHELPEELRTLVAQVRELVDAVAHTEADPDELAEANRIVKELTGRLNTRRRPVGAMVRQTWDGGRIDYNTIANAVSGPANPMAPLQNLRVEGDGLYGEVTLDSFYEGPPGFVHGGVGRRPPRPGARRSHRRLRPRLPDRQPHRRLPPSHTAQHAAGRLLADHRRGTPQSVRLRGDPLQRRSHRGRPGHHGAVGNPACLAPQSTPTSRGPGRHPKPARASRRTNPRPPGRHSQPCAPPIPTNPLLPDPATPPRQQSPRPAGDPKRAGRTPRHPTGAPAHPGSTPAPAPCLRRAAPRPQFRGTLEPRPAWDIRAFLCPRRVSHRTAPAGEQAPALPGPGSGQQPNSGAPTPRGAQSHEDTPERSGSQPRGPAREGAGCPNPASHDRQAAPPLPSAPPPRSQTRSTEPGRRCLPTPCGNRPGFSPDRRT